MAYTINDEHVIHEMALRLFQGAVIAAFIGDDHSDAVLEMMALISYKAAAAFHRVSKTNDPLAYWEDTYESGDSDEE